MFLKWMLKKLGPEKMAQELVEISTGSAFKVFSDQEFREFTNFEKQSQVEQDRFF